MVRKMLLTMLAATGLFAAGAASAADLEDLDFLTGVWRWDAPDGPVEEWWMPAAGHTKVAAFRWVRGDKTIVIELVIIAEEEEGTFLRFKHFGADYTAWEKDAPLTYRLISAESNRAEFRLTAPNPDVPDVFIYERSGDALRFRGTNNPDVDAHSEDLVLMFEKVD